MKVEQEALKENEAAIQRNSKFEIDVPVPRREQVECGKGNNVTACLDCHETCHDDCAFSNDADKASCAAMRDGNCTVCKDRCRWDRHRNTGYIFVTVTKIEKLTIEDLEKRYYEATEKKQGNEDLIAKIGAKYRECQTKVAENIQECREILEKLREIALKPDLLSTVDYIDLLIKTTIREKKERWQETVEELENLKGQAKLLQDIQTKDNIDISDFKK